MDLITILGLVAAILTTTSFLPQVIKVIKTKQIEDLSLGMYILISVGVLLWTIYGLFRKDWPVVLANGITCILTIVILYHIIKYKEKN